MPIKSASVTCREVLEQENFCFAIGKILTNCRKYMDTKLKHLQLTRIEWLVIVYLRCGDYRVKQCDMQDYIGIDKSQLTRALDNMEARNLIQRDVCLDDKRIKIVEIHPNAKDILEETCKQTYKLNDILMQGLTSSEQKQLYKKLNTIAANIEEQIK